MRFLAKKIHTAAFLILTSTFVSCDRTGDSQQVKPEVSKLDENLIHANREAVITEDEQINELVRRYQWPVVTTGTGLRYVVYSKGTGQAINPGSTVTIRYELKLLSGEVVEGARNTAVKTFKLGTGQGEAGLEEALLLMKKGDKAKVIVPSYLAYGLTGDPGRIPPKATLIYDVEITDNQ